VFLKPVAANLADLKTPARNACARLSGAPMAPSPEAPAPERPRAIAVALEEQADASAPKVLASGRGALAEQILAIAFANGVKVREDADLAEVLTAIDIDNPIPTEAYAAVAEILSYLYRANGKVPAGFALQGRAP
jgi:flagellar biosynthesis protein